MVVVLGVESSRSNKDYYSESGKVTEIESQKLNLNQIDLIRLMPSMQV